MSQNTNEKELNPGIRDYLYAYKHLIEIAFRSPRCVVSGHNWERSFEQPPDRSEGYHLFHCQRCGEGRYGHESEIEYEEY